jgi:hypothetical protein
MVVASLIAIAEELAKANISALCVDYERYTGGTEEVKDILFALAHMKERTNQLGLLGYSYGTVVASNVAGFVDIKGLVLISPLKKINDLELNLSLECPKLVIYGTQDPFIAGDIDEICSKVEGQKVILETDHFYFRYEEVISKAVKEFFCKVFS